MPRKSQSQSAAKKPSDADRDPRDREYEDVERARRKAPKNTLEIDAQDIVEEIDLDATPEGDGPDA